MYTNRLKQLLCAAALLILSAAPVAAGPAENAASALAITNYSFDGGGHVASGAGRFTLSSTFGQADATAAQGQSRFTLVGGFWGASDTGPGGVGDPNPDEIYLPLIHMD